VATGANALSLESSLPGVFVAGEICSGSVKPIATPLSPTAERRSARFTNTWPIHSPTAPGLPDQAAGVASDAVKANVTSTVR
jgi:hypothetical protein